MENLSIQKANFSWYGISIIPNKNTVDIFLLFKNLAEGKKLFELITKKNKHPSFYCILQPDKTHNLKIDFTSSRQNDDYIIVSCEHTIETYPSLELLKQKKNFKIIIGTEQITNGQVQTMGTTMDFLPKMVKYVEHPEQFEFLQEQYN